MDPVQQKILELAKTQDVLKLGLRPLGRLIDVKNPQRVKYHLQQLIKKGLVKTTSPSDLRESLRHSSSLQPNFITIPVVGAANCGPATLVAEERIEKYIKVSESLLKKTNNIFALMAEGDSMDRANINGSSIEEGDYVIVDRDQISPRPGDYVLSVIENHANIKKFSIAKDGNIVLLSESSSYHAPIYIGENDQFFVNGMVIQVIKSIK
jgi:SOS-response transcriptional repressor LexA